MPATATRPCLPAQWLVAFRNCQVRLAFDPLPFLAQVGNFLNAAFVMPLVAVAVA